MKVRTQIDRDYIVKRIRARYGLKPSGAATIYVLHFTTPLGHARHYVGYTGWAVEPRIAAHRQGRGATITRELMARGGDFVVALTFKLSLSLARTIERKLKNSYSGPRLCPLCARAATDQRNVTARLRRAEKKQALGIGAATLDAVRNGIDLTGQDLSPIVDVDQTFEVGQTTRAGCALRASQ